MEVIFEWVGGGGEEVVNVEGCKMNEYNVCKHLYGVIRDGTLLVDGGRGEWIVAATVAAVLPPPPSNSTCSVLPPIPLAAIHLANENKLRPRKVVAALFR